MSESILELGNLQSGYGEVQVLWDVSLGVRPRQLTALVGVNGAGKTTTLRTVMGSVPPWKGRIVFKDRDVTRLSPHEKVARGLVLVPEGRQLFTEMSVEENLEMGAYGARPRRHMHENFLRVYALFPRLRERRRQRAGTLSGGEQQMLALGRGLMAEPEVLMIDELSLGLAPVLAQQLLLTLKTLKVEGLTIVLVEQNVHLALALSDYAYVLAEGRIRVHGPAREIADMEEVRKAYLGL
jgi:branched-chain amino acid transport system ATP-binding protein